jgi:hypothetical protein
MFDLEFTKLFTEHGEMFDNLCDNVPHSARLLAQPPRKSQMKFLSQNHPKLLQEFTDKITSLKTDPALIDLCDFSSALPIADHAEDYELFTDAEQNRRKNPSYKLHLEKLSEKVLRGIKHRTDLMTQNN